MFDFTAEFRAAHRDQDYPPILLSSPHFCERTDLFFLPLIFWTFFGRGRSFLREDLRPPLSPSPCSPDEASYSLYLPCPPWLKASIVCLLFCHGHLWLSLIKDLSLCLQLSLVIPHQMSKMSTFNIKKIALIIMLSYFYCNYYPYELDYNRSWLNTHSLFFICIRKYRKWSPFSISPFF